MESQNISTLLYLASGVLFIVALRGLSSPDTSRRGNLFGMAGMVIAVATTLALLKSQSSDVWLTIIAGIAIGGVIGAQFGTRIGALLRGEQLRGLLALIVLAVCLKLVTDVVITPEDFFSLEILR